MSEAEAQAFASGRALFNRPFTPEEGLGPLFNQDRCSSCHDLPTSGGHGAEAVIKVSHFAPETGCNTLAEQGGPLLQSAVTPEARTLGLRPEKTPAHANAATELLPPALFGMGLVEVVADADILNKADPEDSDGDGISGRANVLPDGRIGRFGFKAQFAALLDFTEEAIRVEMGLTTPAHPAEQRVNGNRLPVNADPAPDPEVGNRELQMLVDYLRFLAPSLPRPGADSEAVAEGERVFEFLGCGDCHVPTFTTAHNDSPALSSKRFRTYSDLLLHDLGPDLADICTPRALPSEWRTTPLAGLGLRNRFLHDGRAHTTADAIQMHGGEASRSRDLFRRLTPEARTQLLAFLRSL